MDTHLIISANGPWYELFYNLSLFITLVILLYEGYRRQFPLLKWVFLLIITRLLFIAGTKAVTFSPAEWNILFSRFELPDARGKSLAGGLWFGGMALLAGAYLLGFKRNITDAFALALPLGIAIQRAGCFVTGCCYGKISSLPWAVQYPAQTLPHYHQFNDDLITFHDFLSLPVHPVQLYEMAGLLAALGIVFFFRKRWKAEGSLFLFSMILIFAVRFVSEFFRDVHAHTIGGVVFWIFNTTQLILLPLILIMVWRLRKKEKGKSPVVPYFPGNDLGLAPGFILLFLLSFCFRLFKTWFDFSEVVAMYVVFLPAVVILGYRFIFRWYSPRYRWAPLAGFVLPLFLMAQTFPSGQQDSVSIQKYKTIKIGMATGDYENSSTSGHGSGCDRISNTEYFRQEYTLGGVALEFTEENAAQQKQVFYGAKAIFGNHRETRLSDNFEKNNTLFGITPYAGYETKWVGFGGGLHMGNLTYITENLSRDGSETPTTGVGNVNVYPQFYTRLGIRKWIFAEYRFADYFPSALPGFRQQFAIGTGLGKNNGTNLRIGFNTNDITLLSGSFPIENRITLEPMLLWGKSPKLGSDQTQFQFSFGASYRFGFRETTRMK